MIIVKYTVNTKPEQIINRLILKNYVPLCHKILKCNGWDKNGDRKELEPQKACISTQKRNVAGGKCSLPHIIDKIINNIITIIITLLLLLK